VNDSEQSSNTAVTRQLILDGIAKGLQDIKEDKVFTHEEAKQILKSI
jgi:predicted transcriptional regulator